MSKARRAFIQRNLLLSSAAARCYAIMMSLLSLRYRLTASFLCHIDRRARIIGWRNIAFGRNIAVGAGTWLNVNSRKESDKTLTLGDNCFIGRNNFISVGKSVRIGAYCLTGESCSFIGSTHFADPTRPYLATGATADDAIIVGTNCFFGYGASVLGNVQIGHGCIIGAHSLVRSDIPPFSIAVGTPARVIKRFDFTSKSWLGDWDSRQLSHPTEEEYLRALRSSHPWPVLPLSAATSGFGDV